MLYTYKLFGETGHRIVIFTEKFYSNFFFTYCNRLIKLSFLLTESLTLEYSTKRLLRHNDAEVNGESILFKKIRSLTLSTITVFKDLINICHYKSD